MVRTVPVSGGDGPFLYEVYAGTRRAEIAGWGWEAAQQDAFLRMQFQAQSGAYAAQWPDADHRLILDEAGRRVGRIFVVRTPAELRLVDIALLPECRGSGIGTALVRELQAQAAAAGLPLRLSVARSNDGARQLYERLGFREIGQDEVYAAMEWRDGGGL
jgi:ribosomal protein S18 acetylase RimI-like enzyme